MYFDTHCHINANQFRDDINGYVERAQKAGVSHLIVVGWDIESSRKAIKIAERFPSVYAAVAIHPVDAVTTPLSHLAILETLLVHPKVVALGEIGLDYHWIKDPQERAIEHDFFKKQIALANAYKKPVIIHMRDATNDTYQILKANPVLFHGVMHSYSGSVEMMKSFLDLGFYIGLGGPVTFKNAVEPKEVARLVPHDKLLIETDAPYLTPHPYRGKTNESSYIPLIATEIAALRALPLPELASITFSNAKALFKI